MAFLKTVFMDMVNQTFNNNSILPLIGNGKFSTKKLKGTSVVINEIDDIETYAYDSSGDGNIVYTAVDSTPFTIDLDQQQVYSPKINALDEWVSSASLQEITARKGANKLDKDMVTHALLTARNGAGQTLDLSGETIDETNILVKVFKPLLVLFNEADVPSEERTVVLDADLYATAVAANLLQKQDGIESGAVVGVILGMTVVYSNNLPNNVNDPLFKDCLAIIPDSFAWEGSLSEAKTVDGQTFVGTGLQMLEVYGAGVPTLTADGVIKISFDETP